MVEPIDKFIDELLEGYEVSLKLDLTPALSIAKALQKEPEFLYLLSEDLLTFYQNPNKWPKFIDNFKTGVHNRVSFSNSIQMKCLLSMLKGGQKELLRE